MLPRILVSGLLMLTLLACSSSGDGPADPFFNPELSSGTSLPAGANLVSNEAFKQLAQQEGFVWDNPTIRANLAAQRQAQFTADQAEINRLIQQYPMYADLLLPVDPDVEVLADGNYLLQIQGKNGPFQVTVEGKASQMRTALESRARFETAANHLALYTYSYQALSEELRRGLPTPQSLANASLGSVRQARSALAERLEANPNSLEDARRLPARMLPTTNPGAKPPGFPSSPSQEEGAGTGIDHLKGNGCDYNTFNANGLYSSFWWRQKFYHTSVKSQGTRGSCVAFAITGALESKIAIEQSRWVNLSEQFMWGQIASNWQKRWYGDGANTIAMAGQFHDSGWKLSFESAWNYNQSAQRQENKEEKYYTHSCDGYNEKCSDSSHQLGYACTNVLVVYYCGYMMPSQSSERFGISPSNVLYDETDKANGSGLPVDEMRFLLLFGHPMIVSLKVMSGFDYPTSEGYIVNLVKAGDRGSHALQIVGYIAQTAIQQHPTLSAAVKGYAANSGGGYFIVKNSWGYCWGDAGYIYIPLSWANLYFQNVIVFDAVPSSQYKGSPPNIPPTIQITAPNGGSSGYQFPYRQTLVFTAAVTDPDGSQPPTVTWTSDKDGVLGTGTTLQHQFSSPGTRVVTATASDGLNGGTTNDSMTLTGFNQPPMVQILSPLAGATVYANDTQVQFSGTSGDSDGGFPMQLPCSSLSWSSSLADDNPLGSGCSFSKVFTTTGPRTITLTTTDPYGAKGTDTVLINVSPKPNSGPPIVRITSPSPGASFDATNSILLSYSLSDPGGSQNSRYTVIWKIQSASISQRTITPTTCTVLGVPFPCFRPSDYGFDNRGVKLAQLSLAVTDPENLTGTDQVSVSIGFVP